MENKIIIKTPSHKITMWIGSIFFLSGTIACILSKTLIIAPVFILFFLLGLLGILIGGKAEISSKGFLAVLPIGNYYISWEEVEFIETGAGNLVLGNKNKRLCFPSFEYWSGGEEGKAFDFVQKVSKGKKLEIRETKRAILPIPLFKNTKVK
ncbi:hypothetical protein [Mesobacillus thioparans]|uniref:hypothetical protein n=1 Tax=Mesobacillus thioparans TaxID=370439 RepID=UPI0039EF79CE